VEGENWTHMRVYHSDARGYIVRDKVMSAITASLPRSCEHITREEQKGC